MSLIFRFVFLHRFDCFEVLEAVIIRAFDLVSHITWLWTALWRWTWIWYMSKRVNRLLYVSVQTLWKNVKLERKEIIWLMALVSGPWWVSARWLSFDVAELRRELRCCVRRGWEGIESYSKTSGTRQSEEYRTKIRHYSSHSHHQDKINHLPTYLLSEKT